MEDYVEELKTSPKTRFSEFRRELVPNGAGVYLIWDNSLLVYVGMSGKGATQETISVAKQTGQPRMLRKRLASHASGRLSGDQFCVYVANRLVIQTLTPDQVELLSAGTLSLDQLVRDYIVENLSFSFLEVSSGEEAFALERRLISGSTSFGLPLLNPIR